jgi:hypothetical protein
MKRFPLPVLPACIAVFLTGAGLYAQAAGTSAGTEEAIPLRKITVYSSGVAFFEHSGTLSKPALIKLPFNAGAVDDALKSLVINDSASAAPSVHYPSERTLYRTLKTLKIDLSGDPGIPQIIGNLKGEELDISTAEGQSLSGRIIGVEYRGALPAVESAAPPVPEPCLSLATARGIRTVSFREILSLSFKNPEINADLNRALDLIMASRNSETRDLAVELPGTGSRAVSLSYVIPAAVWKVSYRLDLSRDSPFLQGWAIVDNDGDTDWDNVELSLVTGRPVSFIQNLYPPYRLTRPTLPLAIAGMAEARTYDSGWGGADRGEDSRNKALRSEAYAEADSEQAAPVPAPRTAVRSAEPAAAAVETALGQAAGDQFAFTFRRPVTLKRQESAMLPLVEGTIRARKTLVFSGSRASRGFTVHPALGAELINSSGMKLPAGPITVYDGGAYAGDALIEFFPEGEKRLISYGEDLSVTGNAGFANFQVLSMVTIRGGVMTLNRKHVSERTYTIRNASAEAKELILEHPITQRTVLAEPAAFDERTDSFYRFSRTLPANGELVVTVKEELPYEEQIGLALAKMDTFIHFASSQEIPAPVRAAMQRAVELKQQADAAKNVQAGLEARQDRLVLEQDRIRRNLEAAGNQTDQGREYLKRLAAMDGEIDALTLSIEDAREKAETAQAALEAYIASLNLY